MIDINLIRSNPAFVKERMQARLCNIDIDQILELDKAWKRCLQKENQLRKQRNRITIEIQKAKKQKLPTDQLLEEAKKLPEQIEKLNKETNQFLEKRNELLKIIPNIPHETVPIGAEENSIITKVYGKKPTYDFEPAMHEQLLEKLGILHMKRAAKISGAGFYFFSEELSKLERALINYFLDFHAKNGFIELSPPYLVNTQTAYGTGNLPKFESDLYKTKEGLYLIPTAEVPVTNFYANEIIKEKLPKKFCAYTPCFRVEAGKHGSKTPGFFRVHQFSKVEMVCITTQEESWTMLEQMRKYAEKLLEKLGLHYRTRLLSAGDMGIASAKTYDLDVYAPGMKQYLETSSISNCTDYQARRMNTKYKEKGETKFVHTLNGSGLALPRTLIALVETYQTKKGTINIPPILKKYLKFEEIGKTAR